MGRQELREAALQVRKAHKGNRNKTSQHRMRTRAGMATFNIGGGEIKRKVK
jgi:hypothetical protein